MQIRSCNKRNKGSALFLGILIILGLAVGGCVIIKVISQAHKIKQHLDQVATNAPPDEIVQVPIGHLPHQEAAHEQGAKFQVNTNDYNEALEDESGF
jgi:hypothetical protein